LRPRFVNLTAILKRATSDAILTYFAARVAKVMKGMG
jgi:hypothetical protein